MSSFTTRIPSPPQPFLSEQVVEILTATSAAISAAALFLAVALAF